MIYNHKAFSCLENNDNIIIIIKEFKVKKSLKLLGCILCAAMLFSCNTSTNDEGGGSSNSSSVETKSLTEQIDAAASKWCRVFWKNVPPSSWWHRKTKMLSSWSALCRRHHLTSDHNDPMPSHILPWSCGGCQYWTLTKKRTGFSVKVQKSRTGCAAGVGTFCFCLWGRFQRRAYAFLWRRVIQ